MIPSRLGFIVVAVAALVALVGCKGSPNVALPPPPAPRAFVTNSHAPLSVCVFCCGGTPVVCFVSSGFCGGLSQHRQPLGHRQAVRVAASRLPLTIVATNLINVYSTPLSPSGAPSFMLGRPSGLFGHPGGIAFDSAGNMYVIDFANNGSGVFGTIFVYNPPINASSAAAFHFAVPGAVNAFAIAFDPRGSLWATDKGNSKLVRFDPPFSSSSVPSLTWAAGCLSSPAGLAFDRADSLYVACENFGRVLVWRSSQTGGATLGPALPPVASAKINVSSGCSISATSVAFDVAQRMFVGFKETGNIRVFTPPFGSSGTGQVFTMPAPGALLGSGFAVIDQSNDLFVPFVGDSKVGVNRGGLAVFIPPYSSSSAPIFVLTTSIDNPYGIAFGR